ncbi:peptide chain release factor N(5)-glutamine methyltransferase [Leucobacter chinensis]|uniref:peptide chain release factor N(5)-glutamine methyltransferase n=1 Tax=Leucobacter chinensis TaxID=2851010 RepID=UPI0020B6CAF5|nr:peptide chain release factor N(5)-glutamine methyltransferase [Leucobacter chinensis]
MSSEHSLLIHETLLSLSNAFETAGIPDPQTDAELIVGSVLGESRGRVQSLAIMGGTLEPAQRERIESLASERAQRVPLQHLTGKAPFRHFELDVGPGVFVPRPETETVVQFAIDELQADMAPEPLALDLCTGSGAIALAMASEVQRSRVWAVEKDDHARAWAERNVARLGDGRVTLLAGDVTSPPAEIQQLKGRLSVIATNPPYVPSGAIPRDPEVRDHDPQLALYSGEDGLSLIRVISRTYREYLRPGGLIVIEHAEMQGSAVRDILAADGWNSAATHRDLTFRDRATTARA